MLALVPFLGYVAVGALTLQLAMTVTTTPPMLAFALGFIVLFCGDKVVRPVVARDGVRLRFVWVLMDVGFTCAFLATPYGRRLSGATQYIDGGVNIMA